MTLSAVQLDRAVGALVGLAVGDALGQPYEFDHQRPNPVADMIGGGPFGYAPGEWTDDTQMALCIAEVAATGDLDPSAVGDRFLSWLSGGATDVGGQIRRVLTGAVSGSELAARSAADFTANPTGAAGNGSLMRTAPVALAHLGDDEAIAEAARAICSLTHGDPLAQEACVLWCIAIDRAVRHGCLDGIRDGLSLLGPDAARRWAAILDEAESSPPRRFAPNGFVVTALQAAWSAITRTPVDADVPCRHFESALQTAVKVGSDTDTVGAIAGALLGARWGASGIPMRWKQAVHGWPGYGCHDLVRLAVLAASGGRPDAARWPSAPTMLPYYERVFPGSPMAIALPDDRGVLVGNVHALESVRANAVVSLCRIGPRDRVGMHYEVWLMDDPDPDVNPNLAFLVDEVVETMRRHREAGETVFVHCVRAESRTPFVAAAYLSRVVGLPVAEAIDRVARSLPGGTNNMNPAFRDALPRLDARRDAAASYAPAD